MRQQPDEYAKIRDINAGLDNPDMEKQDILDLGKNECTASTMGREQRHLKKVKGATSSNPFTVLTHIIFLGYVFLDNLLFSRGKF